MNDISKDTIKKIKEQGIVPRTRGYFLFRRSTVWGLFVFSVISGSFACGIAVFQIRNTEWDLFKHFHDSIVDSILLFIPIFWFLFLTGFSIVAYYYFRRTPGGYRYRTVTAMTLSVLLSVIGGMGIYATGLSEHAESVFEETLPFYHGINSHSRKVWMSPDKGLLAGKIVGLPEEGIIRLKDLNGKEWNVTIRNTAWRGRLSPSIDLEIKLIGTRTGEESFNANEIRPWAGRRKQVGKGLHRGKMFKSPGAQN